MYFHPAVRVDRVEAEGSGVSDSATRLVRVAWAEKVEVAVAVAEQVVPPAQTGVWARGNRGSRAKQRARMRRGRAAEWPPRRRGRGRPKDAGLFICIRHAAHGH